MKTILVLIFILTSFNAHAGITSWFKGEAEESEIKEQTEQPAEEVEEAPKFCHRAMRVSNNAEGAPNAYYIFRMPCGEVTQVGILDETNGIIFSIRNTRKDDDGYKYKTQENKLEYIQIKFPRLTPLEIYRD